MNQEEAPYEFKIHLFLDTPLEASAEVPSERDINLKMFEKLESLGAKKISDFYMRDNKGGNSDKIRYTFVLEEKELA